MAPKRFYKAETYRPEDSVGFVMRQVVTLLAAEVDAELSAADLTNAQWQPLVKLYWGHAATVAELARECRLDAGAMTRMLDRLETKGLVQRERSSTDRRVVNLVLTEQGEVDRMGPGSYFGEMSLLTGEPRTATIRAVKECELLVIDKAAFRQLLETSPQLAEHISQTIASRQARQLEKRQSLLDSVPNSEEWSRRLLKRIREFFSV